MQPPAATQSNRQQQGAAKELATRSNNMAEQNEVNDRNAFQGLRLGRAALLLEKEELQCGLQEENRIGGAERLCSTASKRLSETERVIAQLQERLQESEGHLADKESELREEETRRRQVVQRVMDMEERVRVATERQRRAEERTIEAENTRRQAEERQGDFERRVMENEEIVYRRVQQAEQAHQEALRRSQAAENRLTQETLQRMECEQQIQQLRSQLEEAERAVNSLQTNHLEQQDGVFWRVERREIHLSQQELGRGGWASVKVAEFRGLKVAAKCLHSVIISDHNRQLFLREMNMAAQLRHPHLVQFIGATVEDEPIILTELMSTSLRDILGSCRLEEQYIKSIGHHVALALNYMHQISPDPVLHRDVSSANVLLNPSPDGGWVAKLSDYGSANFTRLVGNTAGLGNPSYAAPEASDPTQQSPKMDVFSFGVMLLEMATGQFPDRLNLSSQLRGVSQPMLQLIQRCISDQPASRPTIAFVLNLMLPCKN